jgi:hypothetical protein
MTVSKNLQRALLRTLASLFLVYTIIAPFVRAHGGDESKEGSDADAASGSASGSASSDKDTSASQNGGGMDDAPEDPNAPPSLDDLAELYNFQFFSWLLIVFAALAGFFIIYRIIMSTIRYLRTLVNLNNETQRYFAAPNGLWANIKKHLLNAPLFKVRHSREYTLGSFNMGVTPTRFQTLFIALYVGMNIAFCVSLLIFSILKLTLMLL